MRALSNERRALNQNLEEAEAGRIEAESRVLNTAQHEMELTRVKHAQQMSSFNKAWGTLIDQELEDMRLKNEDMAKRAREETELQMKEVHHSFMVLITKLTETESELYKLKKRASRATGQGTLKEPSAPAKGALSFQETVEDKETARHRAMLTAELWAKQSKQSADKKRVR